MMVRANMGCDKPELVFQMWQYASRYHKVSVSSSVKWVVKYSYLKELIWEFQETVPGGFIIYSRINVGLWWTLTWTNVFLFFLPFWAVIPLPFDMMLIKRRVGGGVCQSHQTPSSMVLKLSQLLLSLETC